MSYILIADDHPVFRAGLQELLARSIPKIRIVATATLDEALAVLGTGDRCLLAVVDLAMPGMSLPAGLDRIRDVQPKIRIVVLSASERRADMLAALDAGAHSYVVKSAAPTEIVRVVRRALGGEFQTRSGPQSAPADRRPAADRATHSILERLTPRQREILQLLCAGASNKEMARDLGISENTVKIHLANAMRLLGARNRTDAAIRAAALGFGGGANE